MLICHVSSVHSAGDPRIRLKQLASVSQRYGRTIFITGDLESPVSDNKSDRIEIKKVSPGRKNRILRLLITSPRCILVALRFKAEIYHLHDPELLPWAWILRLSGGKIVYDTHEDYVSSIGQKKYLPRLVRKIFGYAIGILEKILSTGYRKVIAEKYYAKRFPDAVPVLNYPVLKDLLPINAFSACSMAVIYTGNITPDRGAFDMAAFHNYSEKYKVKAVGRCSQSLHGKLDTFEQSFTKQPIEVEGVGYFVQFSEIISAYRECRWLAGVALFPNTEHYREKELTKFFEYMAVGLPIIASDFPVWKRLIEDQGVGICVPPGDNQSIESALNWLKANPGEAQEMGRRGKELARTQYSWESQAARLIDFYEEILGERQAY